MRRGVLLHTKLTDNAAYGMSSLWSLYITACILITEMWGLFALVGSLVFLWLNRSVPAPRSRPSKWSNYVTLAFLAATILVETLTTAPQTVVALVSLCSAIPPAIGLTFFSEGSRPS